MKEAVALLCSSRCNSCPTLFLYAVRPPPPHLRLPGKSERRSSKGVITSVSTSGYHPCETQSWGSANPAYRSVPPLLLVGCEVNLSKTEACAVLSAGISDGWLFFWHEAVNGREGHG